MQVVYVAFSRLFLATTGECIASSAERVSLGVGVKARKALRPATVISCGSGSRLALASRPRFARSSKATFLLGVLPKPRWVWRANLRPSNGCGKTRETKTRKKSRIKTKLIFLRTLNCLFLQFNRIAINNNYCLDDLLKKIIPYLLVFAVAMYIFL